MEIYVIQRLTSKWKNNQNQLILEMLSNRFHWGNLNYSISGKPFVDNGFISVSHSNELMIIGHHDQEIGIDCEYIRPLNTALIQKLHLDQNNPILDWCKRESVIKLLDDKTYLLKKELNDIYFKEITLNPKFCIVLSSKQAIDTYDIVYLDENLDIIKQTQ
jgi:phosphopantetheinyl transferase